MNPLAVLALMMFAGMGPNNPGLHTPRSLMNPHRKVNPVIKAFNAFQLVALFAALPHLIGWLHAEPFAYSTGAFWVAIAAYVVLFFGLIFCVYDSIDGK